MAIYSEFSHKKWWFSIAMLVYQRVTIIFGGGSQHFQVPNPFFGSDARLTRAGTSPSEFNRGQRSEDGCGVGARKVWSWSI